jgi:hypothetical protein
MQHVSHHAYSRPIAYSIWTGKEAMTPPSRYESDWRELVDWLHQVPVFPTKEVCPLIKLATFGTQRLRKADGTLGSYRNDQNILHVYGIEVDYDGGAISPQEAIERLEQHQLRAVVYTSFSHTSEKPRWRALFPLGNPIEPAGRLAFAEAINGLFNGALASESGTLSQSYFVGRNPGGNYQVLSTFEDPSEGLCLDEIDDWYVWRQPFARKKATESGESLTRTRDETAVMAEEALETLLTGANVHESALYLVGRWVAKGLSNAEIRHIMAPLAERVGEVRGYDRAQALMGDELDRMIQGAREKGYTPPEVDFSVLMESLHAGAKEHTAPVVSGAVKVEHQNIPEHLLQIPGILGKGVQWTLENAKKPQPIYAVQAMLAFGATVLGRRYCTDHQNWPSLFLPVLGLSATGKEAIKSSIEKLLNKAGLSHLIGPSRYTSDSGLISSLVHRPSHICVSDEFGKLLSAASEPNNGNARATLRQMMEVWGRCDDTVQPVGYATAGLNKDVADALNNRVIHKPALTFVGLSTPDTFYEALTRGALIDGFINRMLIVECRELRKPSVFRPQTPPPDDLIAWAARKNRVLNVHGESVPIKDAADVEPGDVTIVPFSPEAIQRVYAFEAWCIEQQNELQSEGMAEMYGRTNEIAMRLSLIVAVSCESERIELEHLDWAISYTAYWTREMVEQARFRVADGVMDAAMKDVERLLRQAGEVGMSLRDLRKRSRKLATLPPRGQVDVLQMLKADQMIEMRKITTRTKPKEVWVYVGDEV